MKKTTGIVKIPYCVGQLYRCWRSESMLSLQKTFARCKKNEAAIERKRRAAAPRAAPAEPQIFNP
jgi:hypothetical protein